MEERRRFNRYSIYCPIEYKTEDSHPRDSSVTLNICEGGALISVPRQLGISSNMIVKLRLKDKDFFIRSKVIHLQGGQGTGPYSVGIEFLERPVELIRNFYEELETIMFYQKQYSEEMGREIPLPEASMLWYGIKP